MERPTTLAAWIILLVCWIGPAPAADDVVVETVLEGLDHPCGVAIRPGRLRDRYEIYVAESGAHRVVRTASDNPIRRDAIIGFPKGVDNEGPLDTSGPTGLLFLDEKQLAVGVKLPSGSPVVRVYELPEDAQAISADQSVQEAPINFSENGTANAIGSIYALTRNDDNLFAAAAGGDVGWIFRGRIRAGEVNGLKPFITTQEVGGGGPAGLVINPEARKRYLLSALTGLLDTTSDSLLVFYHPNTGKELLRLETNLYDIVGLAYSPRTGYLYALDAAWGMEEEGGLYRIENAIKLGKPACNAEKLTAIHRPTSLAFGPNGSLYVSALGASDSPRPQAGALLKITGNL